MFGGIFNIEEFIGKLFNLNPALLMMIAVVITCFFLIIIKIIQETRTEKIYNFDEDIRMKKENKENKKNRDFQAENKSVFLGTSAGKKKLYLKENVKNVYVCGTTGSGKTVALSNFIDYSVARNIPLLIIDGKGDTDYGSLLDIVNKLKGDKKLYVIDLNNPSSSDKYNPFGNTSYTIVKDMLINMTDWSEEHYKTNTERYLQRLVELLDKNAITLSFKTIVENMSIDKFQILSTNLLKQEIITKDEHIHNLEFINKDIEKIIIGASARFATILESELGVIFEETGIDIYTALRENAIILFILNPLIYPELSQLVGRLITIDSKKAVSNLFKNKVERGFFIFDEINVYSSPTLLDLVNKSRSANITCILASQSLSDLEAKGGEYFKEQIIENCNCYVVMRQNSAKNAEQWADIIGTKNSFSVTYQIEDNLLGGADTGKGSVRKTREYIYHPDEIKSLPVGMGFLINKDSNSKTKIIINKPF
ncbi:MAG: type IV secretion system DNA-binding domain-containing protein [Oscillospiraceae bacterium]|nr:type IV secretion system DNA-binding domain-containing protein [Oscillospiraceae bacterium]